MPAGARRVGTPETPSSDAAPAAAVRLAEGDIAPDFQLLDADGNTVASSQLRGQRYVLYFYPAAGTPGCTTEARDFQDNRAALTTAGLTVLAVSPDEPAALAAFRDAQGLSFPLLSDPGKAVLRAYGAYGEKTLGVIRSTFLIGPAGKVEKAMYNVKATGHVAKLLRDLQIPA